MLRDLHAWLPDVERRLRRLPDEVDDAVRRIGRDLEDRVRRGVPVRSGRFARSISVEVDRREARLTSTHPAAEALDAGGVVTGRPWLAIPLTNDARRHAGPRSDGPLVSIRTRTGAVYLATRDGSGNLRLRWRLQHQVAAPALRVLSRAVEVVREDATDRLLAVGRTLQGGT